MAIVRGAGGYLSLSANLLPTGSYTVLTWFKRNSVADFSHIWEYRNTATNYVTLETRAGPLRVYDLQATADAPTTSASCTVNTWHAAAVTRATSDNSMSIVADFGSVDSGGSSGTYQTPASPDFTLFSLAGGAEASPTGFKVGAIAIYGSELDATDLAHLNGGGNPTDLPSATAPTALWIDSAGVAKDGSNNLTTWTDEIGGLVLTPSGTVTVDDADTAPVAYSAGPAAPTLDSVPATAYPGEPITVTGSDLTGASADFGGETASVTVNSDTEIEVTIAQGDLPFGTDTLTVTTSGGSATDDIELIVEPGTGGYVDVVDPAVADTSSLAHQFEAAGGDPVATGDQCQWRYTGTPGDPTSMTVQADTLVSALDAEGSVDVRFWDATDSTWGSWTELNAAVPVVDETAPTVSSVAVPADGTYGIGDSLSFTVNWDEAVDVTGTPALNLDIGGSARQANYASGTGTSALVFSYTVQSGDLDTNGITVSSLTLDGGTIVDQADTPNAANLTLNSVGATSGILVDGVAPVISINPLTTLDTSPIVSGSAGDATSLTLVVTGVGTYNPTPSGGTWSQQLSTLALGDYAMTLNGVDAAGNAAVEKTATLSVVDELPAGVIGRIKQSRSRSNRRYPARV